MADETKYIGHSFEDGDIFNGEVIMRDGKKARIHLNTPSCPSEVVLTRADIIALAKEFDIVRLG